MLVRTYAADASSGLVLTCHTAFFSPSSIQEIRIKSAQTMRDVVSPSHTTGAEFQTNAAKYHPAYR